MINHDPKKKNLDSWMNRKFKDQCLFEKNNIFLHKFVATTL